MVDRERRGESLEVSSSLEHGSESCRPLQAPKQDGSSGSKILARAKEEGKMGRRRFVYLVPPWARWRVVCWDCEWKQQEFYAANEERAMQLAVVLKGVALPMVRRAL
jgi:hypothetical protein